MGTPWKGFPEQTAGDHDKPRNRSWSPFNEGDGSGFIGKINLNLSLFQNSSLRTEKIMEGYNACYITRFLVDDDDDAAR